jgi:hypothetical protein
MEERACCAGPLALLSRGWNFPIQSRQEAWTCEK